MIQIGDKVKFNTDNWNDLGKIYEVESVDYRENSTAVELTVDGIRVTLPSHWIEKV